MANKSKGVLILSPFFSPNVGGVETNLDDLVVELDKLGYRVFVQTYPPITTRNVVWRRYEERGKNVKIWRYRWVGYGLFHKLEKFPLLDFLYLTPYLFFRVFVWLLFNRNKIKVIHAHGFNAALVGAICKEFFGKRLIVSTHAIYEIDRNSSTAKLIVSILNRAEKVLCLSKGSYDELVDFGVNKNKIDLFRYWVDLKRFKPLNKGSLRKELGIENKFTVLFVGRLIRKKGVRELVSVAEQVPKVNFIFIGVGPEEGFLRQKEMDVENIRFLGAIPNNIIYRYYNIADMLCIPSQYEEGYGRVVMEAAACGLPVVGSNRGGIPEALDDTISMLVEPTVEKLTKAITKLYRNKPYYQKLKSSCRRYAEQNFSEKNVNLIVQHYQ